MIHEGQSLHAFVRRYVLGADVTAEDQAAFDAESHEQLVRMVQAMCWLLSGAMVVLWPFDRLILARAPADVAAYDRWRPSILVVTLAVGILMRVVPAARRHVVEVMVVGAGLLMALSAYWFVPLGGFDGPYPTLSLDFKFLLVPMMLRLRRRIVATLCLSGFFVAGMLASRPELVHHAYFPFFVVVSGLTDFANVVFGQAVYHSARQSFIARRALAEANAKSERLLLNILPAPVAERLKESHRAIADRFGEVTVLFADICGFTPLSESMPPERLVSLLNDIFTRFDALVDAHGLEKIKTIGDAYMVAGGLPVPRADHAEAVATLALEMAAAAATFKSPTGEPVRMRIGVHTGPVVAGVIGAKKFSYDLWGDTVNTASRMESHGVVGGVTLSAATRERLGDAFDFEDRGVVTVKGKGEMRLFQLTGRRQGSAVSETSSARAGSAREG